MVKKRELAVVIPYYKIDYFEETLISLKNQTNRNFNIYVGNDCSPSSLYVVKINETPLAKN